MVSRRPIYVFGSCWYRDHAFALSSWDHDGVIYWTDEPLSTSNMMRPVCSSIPWCAPTMMASSSLNGLTFMAYLDLSLTMGYSISMCLQTMPSYPMERDCDIYLSTMASSHWSM